MSISRFNGHSNTFGKLIDGPIKDFNLITKEDKYKVETITTVGQQVYQITRTDKCFIYSHQSYISLKTETEEMVLPTGYLALVDGFSELTVNGTNLIVITLKKN